MFLAGLKFAVGLMTGVLAVFGIVVGLMVVTEWVIGRRKKQRCSKHGVSNPARVVLASQPPILLLIRYPAWVDGPAESEHRKSESMK
jgi:heme/copper-type cytochrome/quinol oxidase subunit 2